MKQELPRGIGIVFVKEFVQDRNYEIVVQFADGDEADCLEFYDTKVDALDGISRFARYCELVNREGYCWKPGTHSFQHSSGCHVNMWELLTAESEEEFTELVRTRLQLNLS